MLSFPTFQQRQTVLHRWFTLGSSLIQNCFAEGDALDPFRVLSVLQFLEKYSFSSKLIHSTLLLSLNPFIGKDVLFEDETLFQNYVLSWMYSPQLFASLSFPLYSVKALELAANKFKVIFKVPSSQATFIVTIWQCSTLFSQWFGKMCSFYSCEFFQVSSPFYEAMLEKRVSIPLILQLGQWALSAKSIEMVYFALDTLKLPLPLYHSTFFHRCYPFFVDIQKQCPWAIVAKDILLSNSSPHDKSFKSSVEKKQQELMIHLFYLNFQ